MLRLVLVLALLGGCDVVFSIPIVDDTAHYCGPYSAPVKLAFDAALAGPNDFSVASDGLHGVVYATSGGVQGPFAVVFDGGTWVLDTVARQDDFANTFTGAHMVANGDVVGWIDANHDAGHTNVSEIVLDTFSGAWGLADRFPSPGEAVRDLRAGNKVETDLGLGGIAKYVVQLKVPRDGSGANTLDLMIKSPQQGGGLSWFPTGFGETLSADTTVKLQGGVVTSDHKVLVYSATDNGVTSIYETQFDVSLDTFPMGHTLLTIGGGGHGDQPWIDDDCSTIWFRRSGAVWMAKKR